MQLRRRNFHPVLPGEQLRAKGGKLLLHGRYAVALLQAQPAGAHEHPAPAGRRQRKEHRAEIRAVAQRNFGRPLPEALHCPAVAAVALQAVRAQAGQHHITAEKIEGVEKRGVGVVPLHGDLPCPVGLPARDRQAVIGRPACLHAELPQRIQGQEQIGAALDRGGQADFAPPRGQRQRKEQTADKLAADIAGQPVNPCGQPARHGEPSAFLPEQQPPLPAELGVHLHRPLHQPAVAGKGGRGAREQGRRDEEAQRAAALATGQHVPRPGGAEIGPPHVHGIPALPAAGAQGAQTVHRRLHVLAVRNAVNHALPPAHAGTDEQAVRHAFGGGNGYRPARRPRGYPDVHLGASPPPSSRKSMASRYPCSPCPVMVLTHAARI